MKKVFTLALVMAMTITTFAQVKGVKRQLQKDLTPAQAVQVTGMEELSATYPAQARNMMTAPEETTLSFTAYDWQTNAASRNFTAVWPDGFAVVCYTQATQQSFSDRGTGLAIWDPAVGEWEFTETRVEGIKTGFGSIARYKENGLVVAAHTATDLRIFLVEDFREGNRNFGEGITLPMASGVDGTHPAVQCSGENLDIVNVLAANFQNTTPYYNEAIFYWRYENGTWTKQCELLPNLDATHITDGGTNNYHFVLYDPAKPNRVAFVLDTPRADGKVVVSEDNGDSWTDRVFYQHPGIDVTYEGSFLYPRWVDAHFDADDNVNIVYEWNGSSGEPTSGSYYPTLGGVSFWSESLPKNEMCIGGIGNVGEPFIMDSTYLEWDLYRSEWYWEDAEHDPLPEYFGELQILDAAYNVFPWWEEEYPETYYWVNLDLKEHGSYNSGIAAFPSMHIDGDRIFAFWSMIAGDETVFYDQGRNKYRLFACMSDDRGRTWHTPVHLITDFMALFDEMAYGQLVPYVYSDDQGEYLWYLYMNDGDSGTYVMFNDNGEDPEWDDAYYRAVKVYISFIDEVEENTLTVAPTINVYPNPANGSFNVALNNESDVNIFNTVGQLVKTYNNVTTVNVNLESGVYFVNANNQTVKVVVK